VVCLRHDDSVIVMIVVNGDVGMSLSVVERGSMMSLRAVLGQNCWRI
jgi:hypothetical protein